MTDYPYSFYIVGWHDVIDASNWCSKKLGPNSEKWKQTWYQKETNKIQYTVAKFDFVDSTIAFEFALVWN